MATNDIVPRDKLEGNLGNWDKHWKGVYAGNITNTYDTVALMKADVNLLPGDSVRTLGHSALNDGGGDVYKIRVRAVDDVDDGDKILILDEIRVAERISQDDYFSYKEIEYPEILSISPFKSLNQAAYEWEQQKAKDITAGTLTVATFNTYGAFMSKPVLGALSNLPMSKQLIIMLMLKAQVICLNEVFYDGTNYNSPSLYNAAGKFPYSGFYSEELRNGYEYGALTKSAYEILSISTGLLPTDYGFKPAGYSKIVINVGGKTVSIYSTHLEWRNTEQGYEVKRLELAALHTLVASDTSDYKIIMGDMNTSTLTDFAVFTNDGYKLVNTGQYETWEDSWAIDNIIVSSNITILDSGKIAVTQVPNEYAPTIPKAISDHSPIWARLSFD